MSDVRKPGKIIDDTATARETHAAREHAADQRQLRADERERLADERERAADGRELLADQREQLADRREAAADQREADLEERELKAGERSQQVMAIKDLSARTLANIETSRALLARSGERLNREEGAVRRQQARRQRQQEEVDRASAGTERGLADWLPDPEHVIQRSKELRQKVLTAIEAFAASEDEVARLHEDLAASQPSRRAEYRRIAEQARDTARKAREILRSATGLQNHLTTAGLCQLKSAFAGWAGWLRASGPPGRPA